MTGRVRVGVVGLGRVAQLHHLPNLASSARVEIVAVCDLSRELTTSVAQHYGLPSSAIAATAGDLISRDLDAVVIANRHHGPLVGPALEAGLPVFVEKPVCWGLDEGAALADLEKRNRPAVVGYMKRYDPAFVRLLGAELSPILVRVHLFAGARHRHEKLHRRIEATDLTGPDAEDRTVDETIAESLGDRGTARTRDVRTLAELAIHNLNLLRTLAGPLTVDTARRFATPFGPGYLVAMNANGTPVSFEVVPDFQSARDWDESVAVFHRDGTTELRFGSPFLRSAPTVTYERFADGTDIVDRTVVVSRDSAYRLELEHFLDCVLGDAESATPIQDAVADLALVYDIARRMTDL